MAHLLFHFRQNSGVEYSINLVIDSRQHPNLGSLDNRNGPKQHGGRKSVPDYRPFVGGSVEEQRAIG